MDSIFINEEVLIPAEATSLEGFRRWLRSELCPERGRFDLLGGDVWADLYPEDAYTHNRVRTEFTRVVGQMSEDDSTGVFFSSGVRLTHLEEELSVMPDALFVSYDRLRSGHVERVPTADGDYDELLGTPSMVLEVVGTKTETRDHSSLRGYYWRAGIGEYWLVDARRTPLRFDILRNRAKGYIATRRQAGGWLKSQVFGRSFRLTQTTDPVGDPRYHLAVRP